MRTAIVGCGDIAARYARRIADTPSLELVGATDPVPGRAAAFVAEHGGRAFASLDAVLAHKEVETVLNLTPAAAHAAVVGASLRAGKHVHTEKPLALSYEDAGDLVGLARDRGLCLSCAPSTLLGEAQQTAWKLIREGRIGTVRVVYAEANWGRPETSHPAPGPLYSAGPMADVGVYPLTLLTAMLGPARRVRALGRVLAPERTTVAGQAFRVEQPDFVAALVDLEGGALVRLTASFYVEHHGKQRGIEFHGDLGSLYLASWAEFDARLEVALNGERYAPHPLVRTPYRGIDWSRALVQLADAVEARRPERLNGDHAAHVVEVLAAIAASAETGEPVEIRSAFEPPEPLEWASSSPALTS